MTERPTEYRVKPTDIPPQTRAALSAQARKQAIEYGFTTRAVDQAEAMVAAGHVILQGRNYGLVYDDSYPDVWRHGWLSVSLHYCSHCNDAMQPRVCDHKLAVAFADLIARHARTDSPPFTPTAARHSAAAGGLGRGRYTAAPRWRRRSSGNGRGKHDHCPRCGAFLTAEGGCNRCGGV